MKKRTYHTLIAILISAIFICCKKDNSMENSFDCNNSVELLEEAATAYQADPSVENCKNYYGVLTSYVDAECFGVLPNVFGKEYYETLLTSLADACE